MNCKPGDLAYTRGTATGPRAINLGHIVEVLRWVGTYQYVEGDIDHNVWSCWTQATLYDRSGRGYTGDVYIDDRNLRPIRDSDGVDETLAWAGHPAWASDNLHEKMAEWRQKAMDGSISDKEILAAITALRQARSAR